jgi:hypothetical protein
MKPIVYVKNILVKFDIVYRVKVNTLISISLSRPVSLARKMPLEGTDYSTNT